MRARNARLVRPRRQLVVMQVDDVPAKLVPHVVPGIVPDRRLARLPGIDDPRKAPGRLHVVPGLPLLVRKRVHLRERQRRVAPVSGEIRRTAGRAARIRAAAAQPFAELPQHAGVVVEGLRAAEERIHVRVGVEHDADE
ncbi:MAG TPA: hypothetical protein VGL43_12055, partial [Casimicrobiaceae bacterium]